MDLFDVLSMIGGLSLFLFGMNIMGQALERCAGGSLQTLLGKLTTGKMIGLVTGMAVTAVIQSSSATTVMVVGFVNSGLMSLGQAINVIMGANVGTTITAWILSLGGIEGDSLFVQLLKPTSFTPILAMIGVVLYMFCKSNKKKDVGTILLGFATLMFGMDTMTGAVNGLKDVPQFQQLFVAFRNPILGVLAGAVLTAIIQSSSASVGILQALAFTGQVTYGAAIPIIMGQNIGTCITALLSSVGTTRNAKRAALVHLCFNVVGTVIWLAAFVIVNIVAAPALFAEAANSAGIAVAHSVFNVACTAILLPMSGLLEKLAYTLVPETRQPEKLEELDERLLATPPMALERCRGLTVTMAQKAVEGLKAGMQCLSGLEEDLVEQVKSSEDMTDHYEDILGSYLVKLSTEQLSDADSTEVVKLMKIIGDLERIGDHAKNLLESAQELQEKELSFSGEAAAELDNLRLAVGDILDKTLFCLENGDLQMAAQVEPLEDVIDHLKERMRTNHSLRLQQGKCSIGTGFIWSDILTDLERTSDHCSNIAACVIDAHENNMNLHESVRAVKTEGEYSRLYAAYADKYLSR